MIIQGKDIDVTTEQKKLVDEAIEEWDKAAVELGKVDFPRKKGQLDGEATQAYRALTRKYSAKIRAIFPDDFPDG